MFFAAPRTGAIADAADPDKRVSVRDRRARANELEDSDDETKRSNKTEPVFEEETAKRLAADKSYQAPDLKFIRDEVKEEKKKTKNERKKCNFFCCFKK